MSNKVYSDKTLRLEVAEDEGVVRVLWLGRSMARDPGAFIGPILTAAMQSAADKRQLVMDFRGLEYMNSSTITPVIRMLHEAKRGRTRVTLVYEKKTKWQDLSFSALTMFETEDKRVEIRGE